MRLIEASGAHSAVDSNTGMRQCVQFSLWSVDFYVAIGSFVLDYVYCMPIQLLSNDDRCNSATACGVNLPCAQLRKLQ